MSKVVKLSLLGAAGAVIGFAAPGAAVAGPVGMANVASVSLPASTDEVHYRRHREGRSAHYCPPRRIEHRTVYVRRIIERRTAYYPLYERRTAYVAAPVATAVVVPVVAASYAYPSYGYGYGGGGPGIIGAGAGLLGGALNIGFGGGADDARA
ncbi:hypothetical protein C5689_17465, partial [Methylosinus sporium]